jgi:type IV pilus assembly protein PilC
MPIFNYRAKDKEGAIKKGVVEAASLVKASEILHDHGFTVLALEPEEELRIEQYIPFLNRVPRKEIVIFSRQLSTLINAKIPIIQSFEILSTQISNKTLKSAIQDMMADIEGGKSLSEAVTRFPHIFSNLYVNMVKAGELSGTLDQSLVYLANQQERDYDLTSKVRGALTYPIFIVSAILIVGALMFVFVLPQMIAVLRESGADLPLTTKILIFLTDMIQSYWLVMLLGLLGGVAGLHFYIRSSGGRIVWDLMKIKLPILGKLMKNIYMDRFSRNLSTLVAGGIPIVTALHTVGDIIGNVIYRQIIADAASEVETGKSIATVFADRPEIPQIVTQMVRVGEQTGSLDEILGKLANFYDKEVERALSTLTTLLEPIIMVLLGLAVAVMVAGVILPIYNLASIQ